MGAALAVTAISAVLVGVSLFLHYSVLKFCARAVFAGEISSHRPLLVILGLVFLVHLAEVMLFAIAYYLMHWTEGLGRLAGGSDAGPADFLRYFYFSISSYTTLGFGDIVPVGALRILAGIEALTGLVLIAWSASFSYFMMERLWKGPDGR